MKKLEPIISEELSRIRAEIEKLEKMREALFNQILGMRMAVDFIEQVERETSND